MLPSQSGILAEAIRIINRVNYHSENVLYSKNYKVVTEIYLKSLGTKKDKKVTFLV